MHTTTAKSAPALFRHLTGQLAVLVFCILISSPQATTAKKARLSMPVVQNEQPLQTDGHQREPEWRPGQRSTNGAEKPAAPGRDRQRAGQGDGGGQYRLEQLQSHPDGGPSTQQRPQNPDQPLDQRRQPTQRQPPKKAGKTPCKAAS